MEKKRHHIKRYYFNEIIGDCETFVYSGSGGNENNFADYMSCRKVCKNECTLKSDTGNCKASFPRFYYNAETSTCEQFIYGGCGGNNNNFRTIKECQKRCEESQHQ